MLLMFFPVLLSTLQGVDSVIEFTCGGCQSGENSPEYYCSGEHRYLYFRCEGSDSSELTWTVSSQDQEELVVLGSLNQEENTIRRGDITVYVDTVDFTNGRSQIISYLWLDLGLLGSNMTVSCGNGITKTKALKQLGSVQPPNSGRAAVYTSPTNERLVLCQWSHDSPDTVHHYNAKTYINGTLMSTAVIPSDTFKEYNTIVSEGTLRLEIEAVGRCGHTATHVIDGNSFQYYHVTEDEDTPTTATTADQLDSQNEKSHSLTTAEAVATSAVVTGVCCFTAGLLLATFVYLFRCRRKAKANDAESQTLQSMNHSYLEKETKKDTPNDAESQTAQPINPDNKKDMYLIH